MLVFALTSLPPQAIAKTTITFGSCIDNDKPDHPIWQSIIATNPQAMIFLGDNVYAPTIFSPLLPDVGFLKSEYEKLGSSPGFLKLKQNTEFFAIWDDHDYGLNDGGADFELKDESQKVFMDFWEVLPSSERYKSPGTYDSSAFTVGEFTVQLLLLDTRYFRSPILNGDTTEQCPTRNYIPNNDFNATILGKDQWRWLEQKLGEAADLHILASSIQVIPNQHCWERWGTMPGERKRLFDLIRSTKAHVVIISGDRHLGEISLLPQDDPLGVGYPLIEVTSSPISSRSGFGKDELNDYRVGTDNMRGSNFGVLVFDEVANTVTAELRGTDGAVLESVRIFSR